MLSDLEKRAAEGKYAAMRLVELHDKPMEGNFDLRHIQEINRYIFQDLPCVGTACENSYKPGQFRNETPKGMVWSKHRRMPEIKEESIIVYSNMDKKTLAEAETFLKKNIDIKKMRKMTRLDFVKKISEIYTQLDYVHLFPDGNSRTLREFTREIGLKAGFDLGWEYFNQNQKRRNSLYIARDLAVNQLAYEKAALPELKYDIEMYMKPFKQYKSLAILLKESACKISRQLGRGLDR